LSIDEAGYLIYPGPQSRKAEPSSTRIRASTELGPRGAEPARSSAPVSDGTTLSSNAELEPFIRRYRKYYRKLFRISLDHSMTPYLTADVWYGIHTPPGITTEELYSHIASCIGQLLDDFPELGGIIFRIGESDGVDVRSPFRSGLVIKKPAQLRRFIELVLPEFEARQRVMVLRTWTLGSGPLGDLLWNRKTLLASLPAGLEQNPSFLLSYKFSQSDFIRHQELNPYALRSPAPFILELQARREYEGFGEFPCFVGFDYAEYFRQLRSVRNMRGIHVWCQTGGWSRFRNISFLKRRSYWNELNTRITLQLYLSDGDLYSSLAGSSEFKGLQLARFLRFLQLSDDLIKNVLYLPGFAGNTLFLHRSRIPALIHVLWDRVVISPFLSFVIRRFSPNPLEDLRIAESAMMGLSEMEQIQKELRLDYDGRFHRETFEIFHLAGQILLSSTNDPALAEKLSEMEKKRKDYEARYPRAYRVQINWKERSGMEPLLRIFSALLIRNRSEYRLSDYVILPALRRMILILWPLIRKQLPDSLNEQAMPIDELLS
ncbi:MAG: hypothetical protein KDK25_04480, partial [Leptospiraceae bacterium]|nr:hypothetical protein [Leptospiraceae bacterium]